MLSFITFRLSVQVSLIMYILDIYVLQILEFIILDYLPESPRHHESGGELKGKEITVIRETRAICES